MNATAARHEADANLAEHYRAPEATAAVIDADGWFNTGDLALFEDDILYIVGRTRELIIRSGFNVGRPVPGNEEVAGFVELLPGSTAPTADLNAYAARQAPPYKRPSEIIVRDALPAGSTGKF